MKSNHVSIALGIISILVFTGCNSKGDDINKNTASAISTATTTANSTAAVTASANTTVSPDTKATSTTVSKAGTVSDTTSDSEEMYSENNPKKYSLNPVP